MVDKNRSRDRMRSMDEVVIRDRYGWLNQGFLKAFYFTCRVDNVGNFYGSRN